MLDESTDVDGKSQLILYLRLRIDGVFVTKFWRIIEMTDGTAAGIIAALKQAYTK